LDILAEVIPHSQQRYPTTGDWLLDEDREGPALLRVLVSKMPDERFCTLVAIHEIIEAVLCYVAKIDEKEVSRFDMLYEKAREQIGTDTIPGEQLSPKFQLFLEYGCKCPITDESEPGDDVHAPYYKQHQLATSVERMMGAEMGVDWNAYEQANLELYK